MRFSWLNTLSGRLIFFACAAGRDVRGRDCGHMPLRGQKGLLRQASASQENRMRVLWSLLRSKGSEFRVQEGKLMLVPTP